MAENIFNTVKMQRLNSNKFDLSHDVKLSLNMGQLVPIACMEVIPGDKFNISCESLIRFAPLVAPVMHRMDVTMHYFFVPNRILWPNFEAYITNTPDPGTGLKHAFPTIRIQGSSWSAGSLPDYLGIPEPLGSEVEDISALPFAAFQKIYDEYYRDQNMIESNWRPLSDGLNSTYLTDIIQDRKRAWEHDYFTSCLPWAQKGETVDIPLGDVTLKDPTTPGTPGKIVKASDHGFLPSQDTLESDANSSLIGNDGVTDTEAVYDPNGTLTVTATTINDLRTATRLQQWLEKNARGGTRYTENILVHFGVKTKDSRLNRPEYITGVKSPVMVSEVLNTTGTVDAPQGEMAGHGISVVQGKYGSYYATEHGYIMGIMSVLPKTAYQQGIAKHFLKVNDPTEFFWDTFQHLGEQEVKNKEIYAFQGATGDDTFGYIPRYAEYRFESNRVAGDFRSSLDFWHLGRIFSGPPSLNDVFIECDPTHRVFAVTTPTVQKLYAHVYNKITAVRKIAKFGTPQF